MSVGWEWTDRDSCSSRTHVDKTTIQTFLIFLFFFSSDNILIRGNDVHWNLKTLLFLAEKAVAGLTSKGPSLEVCEIMNLAKWKTAGKLANYPRNWNSPPRSLLYSDRNNMRTIKGCWNKFDSKLAFFLGNSIWCDVFHRLELDKRLRATFVASRFRLYDFGEEAPINGWKQQRQSCQKPGGKRLLTAEVFSNIGFSSLTLLME